MMKRKSYSRSLFSWLPSLFRLITVTMVLVPGSSSFSLPFFSSHNLYYKGDSLTVKVSDLASPSIRGLYSKFYSLGYCKPIEIKDFPAKTFKERLLGVKSYHNSVYHFSVRVDQSCTIACRVKLDAEAAENFMEKIYNNYQVNLVLDNLPEKSFPVGFNRRYSNGEEAFFIHNHLSFKVMYHRNDQIPDTEIVDFEIHPYSIQHDYEGWYDDRYTRVTTCDRNIKQAFRIPQPVEADEEVIFTYNVSFIEVPLPERFRINLPDPSWLSLVSDLRRRFTTWWLRLAP